MCAASCDGRGSLGDLLKVSNHQHLKVGLNWALNECEVVVTGRSSWPGFPVFRKASCLSTIYAETMRFFFLLERTLFLSKWLLEALVWIFITLKCPYGWFLHHSDSAYYFFLVAGFWTWVLLVHLKLFSSALNELSHSVSLCSRIGGEVHSMVWDPSGERLAVVIKGTDLHL